VPTRLSRFAEGLMEASWLAAVLLLPVYFNVNSSRVFEPDKVALLRSLVLLILVAWIVKLVDEGRLGADIDRNGGFALNQLLRTPLVAPALGLALVYLVSTVFSITPRASLLGSYQRMQGLYTTLSYLVIFASIATNLRRREQVERIITLAILASLPVSLYGILQRFQLDPIPWDGDVSRRISANLGNSIFLAAYLVMVFPLTLGRILRSYHRILNQAHQSHLPLNLALVTLYLFIASLQLIAQYLSGSRGPALALLIASFFLLLLLSIRWKARFFCLGVVGAGLVLGTLLLLLNLAGGPFESLRNSSAIGRYGQLLDAESHNARVRSNIWRGAAQLVAPHPALEFPDGHRDRLNFLRPLIGYGPESMIVAFNPFYPPELDRLEGHNASPDRSHNETWDALVITGILGLIAYLAMFGALFYHGLRWMGIIANQREKRIFFTLLLAGGMLGAISLSLWRGIGYLGVGLPFGMILGLIAYLVLIALSSTHRPIRSASETSRSLTMAVLLAGVVAHFVEINFGIAITATRTYFWVYAALILVLGEYLPGNRAAVPIREPALVDRADRSPLAYQPSQPIMVRIGHRVKEAAYARPLGYNWIRTTWINAGILALLLVCLGFNHITNLHGLDSTGGLILQSSLISPGRDQPASYGMLLLISITLISAVVILSRERYQEERHTLPFAALLGGVLGSSLLIGFLFAVWYGGSLSVLKRMPPQTVQESIFQASHAGGLLVQFWLVLFLQILSLGLALVVEWPARWRGSSYRGTVVAAGLGILFLVLVNLTNLRSIKADIYFKMAEAHAVMGQWALAVPLNEAAIQLAPGEDHYYLSLASSRFEQAKLSGDEGRQRMLLQEVEDNLLRAQSINPLNPDHTANLAHLYRWWASLADHQSERSERAETSSYYYSRAVTLSPKDANLWGEWAILMMEMLDRPDQALHRLEYALHLHPEHISILRLTGDAYHQLALNSSELSVRSELLEKAVSSYQAALHLSHRSASFVKVDILIALGEAYAELEKLELAVAAYQEAIQSGLIPFQAWSIQEALAHLYARMGDRTAALEHANLARQSAPPDQVERLNALVEQLLSMP
jgi:tetratricopeptide (TPR) repeat protein